MAIKGLPAVNKTSLSIVYLQGVYYNLHNKIKKYLYDHEMYE